MKKKFNLIFNKSGSAVGPGVLTKHGIGNNWGLVLLSMVIALGGMLLAGCESTDDSIDAAMASAAADHKAVAPDYSTNLLEEGDVISITFRYSTNYDTTDRIGLDGNVNLQVAGLVKAADKTVLQLQDDLTKLYQSQDKDDPITVKIVTPEAAVYVSGAVNRPGKIPLEHPMTVLEAIMEAGGSDPLEAQLSDVLVLRVEDGQQKTYHFNMTRILKGEDSTVFYLRPFDVVRVPTKIFNY
jgi:polysaccharide export outer membrane protein